MSLGRFRGGEGLSLDKVCVQVEVVKTQPQIQREERVLDLRTASDSPETETLSTRSGCGVEKKGCARGLVSIFSNLLGGSDRAALRHEAARGVRVWSRMFWPLPERGCAGYINWGC